MRRRLKEGARCVPEWIWTRRGYGRKEVADQSLSIDPVVNEHAGWLEDKGGRAVWREIKGDLMGGARCGHGDGPPEADL